MSTWGKIKKEWRRYMCLSLLVAMATMALSCYGSFPLTNAIYDMNGNVGRSIGEDRVERRVVQSVVMWVLVVVPVYEVVMIADVLVLNVVEFLKGEPVMVSSVQERDGTKVMFQPGDDEQEAVLSVSRNGQLLGEQHVRKLDATTFEMRDASGKLNGTILKTPEGDIQLSDAQGRIVRTLAAKDLAALRQN